MAKKIFLMMILMIFCCGIVDAATISGNVYDLGFENVDSVNVEIDSEPKQRDITEEGFYSFIVVPGKYTITARYYENRVLVSSTSEEINITAEGEYLLDLILFPSIETEEQLFEDIGIEADLEQVEEPEQTDYMFYVFLGIFVVLIAVVIVIFLYLRKYGKQVGHKLDGKKADSGDMSESELDLGESDIDKIIDFIKSKGGRVTQKDIRKHFPSSEAKISLMITELEHNGKIKKIKKGRGNVIILE